MTRTTEGKAQDWLLATLRDQGLLVQKWTDLYATGIADALVALPLNGAAPPVGIPPAMWLEVKATEEVPKRKTSPWWAECRPRPDQVEWLTNWNAMCPAAMFLRTPMGWTCVPVDRLDAFFALPYPETRMITEKPTYGRIVRSWRGWS